MGYFKRRMGTRRDNSQYTEQLVQAVLEDWYNLIHKILTVCLGACPGELMIALGLVTLTAKKKNIKEMILSILSFLMLLTWVK